MLNYPMDKLGQIQEVGFGKYVLKDLTWEDFKESGSEITLLLLVVRFELKGERLE